MLLPVLLPEGAGTLDVAAWAVAPRTHVVCSWLRALLEPHVTTGQPHVSEKKCRFVKIILNFVHVQDVLVPVLDRGRRCGISTWTPFGDECTSADASAQACKHTQSHMHFALCMLLHSEGCLLDFL